VVNMADALVWQGTLHAPDCGIQTPHGEAIQ